ncbi:unnamed protein product, partial [marine sediment metagenome]
DWTDAETTHFDVDGWSGFDAAHYVSIYAVGNASHNSGVWRATGHVVSTDIDIETSYTRVHDMQWSNPGNICIRISTTNPDIYIYNNIIRPSESNSSEGIINSDSGSGTHYYYNNVIYRPYNSDHGQTVGIHNTSSFSGTLNIFNNTITGFHKAGVEDDATGVTNIYNCAFFNNGSDIISDGNTVQTVSNCATDVGGGQGANGVDISGTWDSTCFTDAGGTGPDFSVQDVDSPLYNTGDGTVPDAIFTDDIIGTTRGPAVGDWDIGAFEFAAAGGSRELAGTIPGVAA